jgi:hypothetical protein
MPDYRGGKPFGGFQQGAEQFHYPETRGIFTKAVPRWIQKNVLDLLPKKAKTVDLLRKLGAVETGLSGWPQMREVKAFFPEGFFKVEDLWQEVHDFGNNPQWKMIDLVGMNQNVRSKPEVTFEYWKRAYYHYSMFGMRFAFNEWDKKVLGAQFNKYMNETLAGRIDSYSMALNRLLWEHSLRSRQLPNSTSYGASYRHDAAGFQSSAEIQDVGSIPYYLNGLGFRIGIATDRNSLVESGGALPQTAGATFNIAAVTLHDGRWAPPNSTLQQYPFATQLDSSAPGSSLGTSVGNVNKILWSQTPFFWFPDAPGTPLFTTATGTPPVSITANALAGDDTDAIAGISIGEGIRKLHYQVIGGLERGYRFKLATGSGAAENNARLVFYGATASNATKPVFAGTTGIDYDMGYGTALPFLWEMPAPYMFSPAWGAALEAYVGTNTDKALQHNHWSRFLAVIRATKQPLIISKRWDIGGTIHYPIYFGQYGISTTGNPWAHSAFKSGIDTRFVLTPTVLERLYSYMKENDPNIGQVILACHPNVAIALNIYAMGQITYFTERRSFGPVEFGAEFQRYKNFVIFTDLMIPDGVIYAIVPGENSLTFAFDDDSFQLRKGYLNNAIDFYYGYFIMRLMMSSCHCHGMIWGVRPDTLDSTM